MAEQDSRSAYLAARRMGRRFVSEHEKEATKGYLPVLEDIMRGVDVLGEISLGHHEIPWIVWWGPVRPPAATPSPETSCRCWQTIRNLP